MEKLNLRLLFTNDNVFLFYAILMCLMAFVVRYLGNLNSSPESEIGLVLLCILIPLNIYIIHSRRIFLQKSRPWLSLIAIIPIVSFFWPLLLIRVTSNNIIKDNSSNVSTKNESKIQNVTEVSGFSSSFIDKFTYENYFKNEEEIIEDEKKFVDCVVSSIYHEYNTQRISFDEALKISNLFNSCEALVFTSQMIDYLGELQLGIVNKIFIDSDTKNEKIDTIRKLHYVTYAEKIDGVTNYVFNKKLNLSLNNYLKLKNDYQKIIENGIFFPSEIITVVKSKLDLLEKYFLMKSAA